MAAASIREINRIYGNLQHSSKPIVVLMSNKETLSPELKLRFREQTKIMPGMFFGFHKDDLRGNATACDICTTSQITGAKPSLCKRSLMRSLKRPTPRLKQSHYWWKA